MKGSRIRELLGSVTVRLAIGYGILVIGSLALISAMFYFGTVGVLSRSIDTKLVSVSNRLVALAQIRGNDALRQEVQRILDDGIDSDTEVYLLERADGQRIAGNLSSWPAAQTPFNRLTDQEVVRAGRESTSRLLPRKLPDGTVLVVGRDMQDHREIERLVWRSLETGGALALQLAIGGAFLFRSQIERRLAMIRRTAMQIEGGDLGLRVPVSSRHDEFSRLGHDINHMLDWIQHLMEGVSHVSNAIAHDLRTPLARIRGQLDEALRQGGKAPELTTAALGAIASIDDLIVVFDKLLRIAEAESGTRRQSFEPVPLGPLVTDVVELYDALAEAKGMTLVGKVAGEPAVVGDKDLLATALANLVDNALKYAGRGALVEVRVEEDEEAVSIVVEDDGPGVVAAERPRVVERFYRLDGSRSKPGNGLGLSTVVAVTTLHRGRLSLEDACPGLRARMVLPLSG